MFLRKHIQLMFYFSWNISNWSPLFWKMTISCVLTITSVQDGGSGTSQFKHLLVISIALTVEISLYFWCQCSTWPDIGFLFITFSKFFFRSGQFSAINHADRISSWYVYIFFTEWCSYNAGLSGHVLMLLGLQFCTMIDIRIIERTRF